MTTFLLTVAGAAAGAIAAAGVTWGAWLLLNTPPPLGRVLGLSSAAGSIAGAAVSFFGWGLLNAPYSYH